MIGTQIKEKTSKQDGNNSGKVIIINDTGYFRSQDQNLEIPES